METQVVRLCVACETKQAIHNEKLCRRCKDTAIQIDMINRSDGQMIHRTMMDLAEFFGVQPKNFSY